MHILKTLTVLSKSVRSYACFMNLLSLIITVKNANFANKVGNFIMY